jgi:hypothetical protein
VKLSVPVTLPGFPPCFGPTNSTEQPDSARKEPLRKSCRGVTTLDYSRPEIWSQGISMDVMVIPRPLPKFHSGTYPVHLLPKFAPSAMSMLVLSMPAVDAVDADAPHAAAAADNGNGLR